MHSPIGSPLTPLSPGSAIRNRIPRQIQRVLPLYIVFVVFIFLLANLDFRGITGGSSVVKRGLHHSVPALSGGAKFPRKIWQTWKIGPLSFDFKDQACAKTWTVKNPGYRYEVLTDDNDMEYVEQYFGPEGFNRVDIVDMYREINAKIIKADLLRYLVMYAEGGVYADIDVEALRPVTRFVPERWEEKDIDLVIGVEIDQPEFKDHPILGPKSQSFCQWTFMAKPQHPVMMHLIDNILQWLRDVSAKQNKPVSELVLDFDEVLTGTGPSAFTSAVLKEMTKRNNDQQVAWDSFHSMPESKVVSNILVLTVEAFAAGQGHSDSGNHNSRAALVKHHYHASQWPANHPRFNHPVYGEVERCNWNDECVKKWDADTEAFKVLPPEEQTKLITIKEAEKRKAAEEAQAAEQAKLAADLKHFAELKAAEDSKAQQQAKALQDLQAAANPAQADAAAAALQQLPNDPHKAQALQQHQEQQQQVQEQQQQQPQLPFGVPEQPKAEEPKKEETPQDQKAEDKPKEEEKPKDPEPPKAEEKPKEEEKKPENKEQELKRDEAKPEEAKPADPAPPS